MMDTKTLYAKVASDNLTDDDKDKLLTLLNNLTKQKEAKAKSAKKHMEKLKLDEEAMDKIRKQKMEYYIKNKELINDKERERYNANIETQERKKEKSRLYYHNKFDAVPKMKRGRKPKPIDPDEMPHIRRPRGRPPTKHITTLTEEQ